MVMMMIVHWQQQRRKEVRIDHQTLLFVALIRSDHNIRADTDFDTQQKEYPGDGEQLSYCSLPPVVPAQKEICLSESAPSRDLIDPHHPAAPMAQCCSSPDLIVAGLSL